MTDMFGQYKSQKTRALETIKSSKYPDTNKDLEANMRRLNVFVDYLAQYVGAMQKGVDQANQDVIGRTRDILGNMVILLGGGTVADVDFGDLQYYLPAIGALLGFDDTTPFPINLFNAAEHFFLGYVVPLDSFTFAIQDEVVKILTSLGINQEFIDAFNELIEAVNGLGVSASDFFSIVESVIFDIFGISDTSFLGPFADLWHTLTQLLSGLNLENLGTLVDPVFEALAPWVHDVALAVDYLNQIIKKFSAGVTDLAGILNFAGIFTAIIPDFSIPGLGDDPLGAWAQIFNTAFMPLSFFGDLGVIFGELLGTGDVAGSVTALVDHILTLPDAITDLLNALIEQLLVLPDVLTDLLEQIIDFLIATPAVLIQLITGIVNLLVETPDILLTLLTALIELLLNVPELLINLLGALINLLLDTPDILTTLVNGIIELLVTLPDTLVTLVTAVIEALLELPDLLTTLVDGVVNQLITMPATLTTLITELINQLLTLPDELLNLLTGLINELLNAPAMLLDLAGGLLGTNAFMGPDSALNALNLYNLVPDDLIAQINISNIGTVDQNLITNPGFDVAFPAEGGWEHDAVDGDLAPGCAMCVADGNTHELLSNWISVSEGQRVNIAGRTKFSGLTYTAGLYPVRIGVTGYVSATDSTDQKDIAKEGNAVTVTDWRTMSGPYDVPTGVKTIRVRLIVTPEATAGVVRFDDLSAYKSGLMPQSLVSGLEQALTDLWSNVNSLLTQVVNFVFQTDFDNLVSTIAGPVGNTITDVEERLNSFLHGGSALNADNISLGAIADQFVPGISTINDNIVRNLLRLPGSGFSHDQAADALQSNAYAVVDNSARIAQLETTFTGGVSDGDDFERKSSTTLGPGWIVLFSGGSGIVATPNGHDAEFIPSGTQDRDFVCIRNTGQIRSSTDLQSVASVISTKATRFYDPLLGTYNFCGHNDVWLRISDATTSYANITGIRIRFGADGSVSIDRFVNGVKVTLNSMPTGSIVPPGPGAQIMGLAGIPGTARYFQAIIGTSTILPINEVGVASGLGGAYHRWGFGGRAEGHLLPLPGQEKPGNIHQWTGKDQVAQ
jgi:hypothetical protein